MPHFWRELRGTVSRNPHASYSRSDPARKPVRGTLVGGIRAPVLVGRPNHRRERQIIADAVAAVCRGRTRGSFHGW
jgi:hypothetical protein